MTTTNLTIQRATLADADQLALTIAQAFHDLAPCQWLVEDPATRARIFPAYFRLYAELGLRSGTVLTTPDRQAVAIWLPVRPNAIPALPDHDRRLAAITGPRADRTAGETTLTADETQLAADLKQLKADSSTTT